MRLLKALDIKCRAFLTCFQLEKNFFFRNGSSHRRYVDTTCGRFDDIDDILSDLNLMFKVTGKVHPALQNHVMIKLISH